MSEQDQTVMASTTVITCAGYALINYTYQRPKPLPTLNPMAISTEVATITNRLSDSLMN